MRQTCESERENGGNNDAERERTSESEIEDLGAQLDKACASRPLDRAQHGMTRRTAATHLLTAVLWLATAVILLAMLLRMLPNNLDGKRYVPLIVALMPWLGILSLIIAITAITVRAIGGRVLLATVSVVCVVVQIGGRGLRTFSWRLNERIIICSVPRKDSARWSCISPRR